MVNNIDDFVAYLGYLDRISHKGSLDATQAEGELGRYPIEAFINDVDLTYSREALDGEALWTLGFFDMLTANSDAELVKEVTLNYLGQQIEIKNFDYSLSFTYEDTMLPILVKYVGAEYLDSVLPPLISFGELGMGLGEIQDVFLNNPPTSDWQDEAYWTQTPERERFLDFYRVALALSATTNITSVKTALPPTNFESILTLLESLSLSSGDASIVSVPVAPEFLNPLPDDVAALNALFATYVENYPSLYTELGLEGQFGTDREALEPFLTGWYQYIQQGVIPPNVVPETIPIVYRGVDASGTFTIATGESVDTPGFDEANPPIPVPNPSVTLQDYITIADTKFRTDFAAQMQRTVDWLGIESGLTGGIDETENFEKNWKAFLNFVTTGGTISAAGFNSITSFDDFIKNWNDFIGPYVLFFDSSTPPASASLDLYTYEQIHEVFYPGEPQTVFVQRLISFVNEFMNTDNKVFNPSLFVDQWLDRMITDHYPREEAPLDADFANRRLADVGFEKTRIMRSIFSIIVSMITEVQELTVALANRLSFYTEYQDAYTSLMEEVPVFLRDDSGEEGSRGLLEGERGLYSLTVINGDTTADSRRRADANTLSASYMENLRSFRSNVGDLAKQHQTALGQANESVNLQTNLGTQILQQLSSLSQVIFS